MALSVYGYDQNGFLSQLSHSWRLGFKGSLILAHAKSGHNYLKLLFLLWFEGVALSLFVYLVVIRNSLNLCAICVVLLPCKSIYRVRL